MIFGFHEFLRFLKSWNFGFLEFHGFHWFFSNLRFYGFFDNLGFRRFSQNLRFHGCSQNLWFYGIFKKSWFRQKLFEVFLIELIRIFNNLDTLIFYNIVPKRTFEFLDKNLILAWCALLYFLFILNKIADGFPVELKATQDLFDTCWQQSTTCSEGGWATLKELICSWFYNHHFDILDSML